MSPIERDHERGLNGALAAEIRAELAVQDKTTTWLAAEAGMDRLTLRRYLKAERAMNTALVEGLAQALQVDPGALMARAVARRDAHPDLYSPWTDPETPFNRKRAQREAMQQIEPDAARNEDDET